jgi:tRNA-2-methylthio-N6-dimethylallyladenosine synthase
MDDQIPDAAKGERLARLQDLLNRQQLQFNRASVGRVMAVLLDRPGRDPGQLVGRSPYMQAVHVEAPAAALGTVVDLRIVAAHPNSLSGVAADTEAVDARGIGQDASPAMGARA